MENKIYKLQDLFNAPHNAEISTIKCSGKWSNTSDKLILINNTPFFLYNTSFRHDIEEVLDELIAKYENFNNNKSLVIDKLKNIIAHDNIEANAKNLEPIELIDVDYIKQGYNLGWFYITIKKGDKIIKHLESGLDYMIYAISNNKEALPINPWFYIAGGLTKYDYIFKNVGYLSTSDAYQVKE